MNKQLKKALNKAMRGWAYYVPFWLCAKFEHSDLWDIELIFKKFPRREGWKCLVVVHKLDLELTARMTSSPVYQYDTSVELSGPRGTRGECIQAVGEYLTRLLELRDE